MTGISEEKKQQVSDQQKKCDELLISVNMQRKNAAEQSKIIEERTVIIEREKIDCQRIADEAE